MEPYYSRSGITLYLGDNRGILPHLKPESISAVVTDPPYGLVSSGAQDARGMRYGEGGKRTIEANKSGFMGMRWDGTSIEIDPAFWELTRDTMKPGAHLLAFGGTRTFHRIAVAIEDAGFEMRDTLMWLYGSGFPKSLNVSAAIDKAAGAEREVIRERTYTLRNEGGYSGGLNTTKPRSLSSEITAPATPEARQWDGWGTALKPAYEPILLCRKPFKTSVSANVLAHGTGAINVDASRVGSGEDRSSGGLARIETVFQDGSQAERPTGGRWPPNVILDEAAARELDAMSGERKTGKPTVGAKATTDNIYGAYSKRSVVGGGNNGGASRFMTVLPIDDPETLRFKYQPKASRRERNAGLEGMPEREWRGNYGDGIQDNRPHTKPGYEYHAKTQNHHPTVKPLALMRWLLTLVTPPGGVVLDPFAGSGSTLAAAAHLGISAVGVEMDSEYAEIAARRIDHVLNATRQHTLGMEVTD